jgi:pyrroline-5-carboxylate reductase
MSSLKSRQQLKVVIVGPGQMGQGAASRLLASGAISPEHLQLIGRRLHNLDNLKAQYPKLKISEGYPKGEQFKAEVVILAVKPKDLPTACGQLKSHLASGTIVISLVAAVKLQELVKLLGHRLVVRAMPNVALQVGESYTRWSSNSLSGQQLKLVGNLLSVFGQQEMVETDNEIDVHTIISGTGIALLMYSLRAFIKAAVYLGVRHQDAPRIIYQVAYGSLRLMHHGIYASPDDLIDAVTTPAGTTTRALLVFERSGLSATITEALEAGLHRIKQLTKK